jgi:hypothetical protein
MILKNVIHQSTETAINSVMISNEPNTSIDESKSNYITDIEMATRTCLVVRPWRAG